MLVEVIKFGRDEKTAVSSLDVAETFGKAHKDVLRSIRELKCSPEFNERNFALVEYEDSKGEKRPAYVMTRDGFTMLVMGYTGEPAMRFKEAYIKQFNAMEAQLTGKLVEREKGIAVRQALTKALQQSTENERMHGHAYSNYTNMIYKVLFGMNASQLREKYKINAKDNLRDKFTIEELRAVEAMERMVSGMVDCGMDYSIIKNFIQTYNAHNLLCA